MQKMAIRMNERSVYNWPAGLWSIRKAGLGLEVRRRLSDRQIVISKRFQPSVIITNIITLL
jgi:hypothetical protein